MKKFIGEENNVPILFQIWCLFSVGGGGEEGLAICGAPSGVRTMTQGLKWFSF